MPYHVTEENIPKAGAVLADAFSRNPLWNRIFELCPRLNAEPAAFFETTVRICRVLVSLGIVSGSWMH